MPISEDKTEKLNRLLSELKDVANTSDYIEKHISIEIKMFKIMASEIANIIENKAFILRKQGRDVHQQYATENASFKILGRLRNFERLHALESIDPDLNVFNQEIDDAFGIQ